MTSRSTFHILLGGLALLGPPAHATTARFLVTKITPHPRGALVELAYQSTGLRNAHEHVDFWVSNYDPPHRGTSGSAALPSKGQRYFGSPGSLDLGGKGMKTLVLDYAQLGITRPGRYWLTGEWRQTGHQWGMSDGGREGGEMQLPLPGSTTRKDVQR